MNRSVRWILLLGALLVVALVVFFLYWLKREPRGRASREGAAGTADSRRSGRDRPDGRSGGGDPGPLGRELFGRVTSPGGEAVGGAAVRLVFMDRSVRFTLTDGKGRYLIRGIPRKARRMEVSARGYRAKIFEDPSFPSVARVRWDVMLDPAEGIHGVVLVGDKPVAGAIAILLPEADPHRALKKAWTDLSGRFSLDLPGGEMQVVGPWIIRAVHAQHGKAEVSVDGPGEVTIQLPGGGFVSGRVVDERGRPVTRFSVTASPLLHGHGGPAAQSFDSRDGSFRLGPLAPGSLKLDAVSKGFQPAEAGPLWVESGVTTSGVVITMKGSGVVRGRVTDADTGEPIKGARVEPADWDARDLGSSMGTSTDADGRYSLGTVPGARTSLHVRAAGYNLLVAGGVECGTGEVVEKNFELTPTKGKESKGELTGIGVVIRQTDEGILVLDMMEDGAAWDALQKGDVIVMVNDLDVGKIGLGEVAQAIRGEPGTEVVLWVLKSGTGQPQRVVLSRGRVGIK